LFYPEAGKKLDVAQTARMEEEFLLRPVEGERKLFVLSDFAEASPQVQNKLLKSLEEPPEGVYFLLGATSEFAVLPTVLSRVKRLEIRPFSGEETLAFLARRYGNKYGKEEYALCAAASGGSVGGAQNMIEGGAYKAVAQAAFSLALAKTHELPIRAVKAGEIKKKREFLALLHVIFRDAALVKAGEEKASNLKNAVFLRSEGIRVREIAKKYSLHALLYAQTAIAEAELEVTFNAYFPQCVEVLIAKILRKNGEI
jgi:DNA polymerase-3 subunit delta'